MKKTELLCQALISGLGVFGSKPLANYIMALASNTVAHSATEVTLSPLYHYQFSSFGKMIAEIVRLCTLDDGAVDISLFDRAIQAFIVKHYDELLLGVGPKRKVRVMLDVTPIKKPYSECLADRGFVYCPNEIIAGNKSITVGYGVSCLNYSFEKWSIPWSILRCPPTQTYNEIGVEQLRAFAQRPHNERVLIVSSNDSGYGSVSFIAPLYPEKNLVTVTRLTNRNLYKQSVRTKTGGANGVYGACYALRTLDSESKRKDPKTKAIAPQKASIFSLEADKIETYNTFTTKKKKEITVELRLYKQMMLRSRGGHNMKDKPFDLVVVSLTDTKTGKKCFQRPMYLAVCGQQRDEIALREAYEEHYAHRYDIEPNNRFMKQQLLLEKFQTPNVAHNDVWLRIVQLTEWLLLQASDEVVAQPKKWQKSADKPADASGRLSPAQTRRACETLFLTFDEKPFSPQISNKGKGRKQGTVMPKKTKHPVVRKAKKAKKTDVAAAKMENTT